MMDRRAPLDIEGFKLYKRWLDRAGQEALREDVRGIVQAAPFTQYQTAGGRKMSVRMTSAGDMGWISDRSGYRYAPTHPSGSAWPPIPARVLDVWAAVADYPRPPRYLSRQLLRGDSEDGDASGP